MKMAGVIKQKKRLFEKSEVLDMPERPKRLTIREAEGGFIVEGNDYDEKQKVVKTVAALVKCVKEHFGSTEGKDEENYEDK